MKRTAGAFTLLAALGGCVSTQQTGGTFGRVGHTRDVPGVIGAWGEPVPMMGTGGKKPAGADMVLPVKAGDGVYGASYQTAKDATGSGIVQTGFLRGNSLPPAPAVGPPGAVAAYGALPPGVSPGSMMPGSHARSSIRFAGPAGMKIGWASQMGPDGRPFYRPQLEAPGRYNFVQGSLYRLKLTDIPNRPGLELYPTIEVIAQNPKTTTFLAHSAIPLAFTDDDFEQVAGGNLVVKVIYLPDPQFQDLAIAGPDEVVSTKLEPGMDPVIEAQRRGSVLLIVRLGNIDLEAPNTPGMEAGNPFGGGPGGPIGAVPVRPSSPAMAMPLPRPNTPPGLSGPASPPPAPSVAVPPPAAPIPAMPTANPKPSSSLPRLP